MTCGTRTFHRAEVCTAAGVDREKAGSSQREAAGGGQDGPGNKAEDLQRGVGMTELKKKYEFEVGLLEKHCVLH